MPLPLPMPPPIIPMGRPFSWALARSCSRRSNISPVSWETLALSTWLERIMLRFSACLTAICLRNAVVSCRNLLCFSIMAGSLPSQGQFQVPACGAGAGWVTVVFAAIPVWASPMVMPVVRSAAKSSFFLLPDVFMVIPLVKMNVKIPFWAFPFIFIRAISVPV